MLWTKSYGSLFLFPLIKGIWPIPDHMNWYPATPEGYPRTWIYRDLQASEERVPVPPWTSILQFKIDQRIRSKVNGSLRSWEENGIYSDFFWGRWVRWFEEWIWVEEEVRCFHFFASIYCWSTKKQNSYSLPPYTPAPQHWQGRPC